MTASLSAQEMSSVTVHEHQSAGRMGKTPSRELACLNLCVNHMLNNSHFFIIESGLCRSKSKATLVQYRER